jgi:hypothetical protein
MKKENILYTVLIVVVFSAVAFVAMKYVTETYEMSSSVETFGNSPGLVTTAAKCNCMPGYVANKNASGSYKCIKLCDGGPGWATCSTSSLPCY